jgi:hypothetical protein
MEDKLKNSWILNYLISFFSPLFIFLKLNIRKILGVSESEKVV